MSLRFIDATESVSSKTADAWCTADPLQACRLALHKKPFRAFHGLAKNPLFAVDTLIATAQDAARRTNDVYINVGNVSVAEKWEQIPVLTFPVAEVIRRVQTAEAWIVLKHVETDRRYKSILDEFTDFVKDIAGPEGEKFIRNPEMLVLITSPNRFTPYHFDAEINFLVQIHGSKDVWICDPLDRSITTEEEIERYYAVTITAGTYKPHAEERATRFTLHPGDAVHIPTHAAHWVKNHDEVSVSLSLNFEFPDSHQADVYRANHFLRRLGLNPRPPGNSITDLVKGSVVSLGRAAKRLVRR